MNTYRIVIRHFQKGEDHCFFLFLLTSRLYDLKIDAIDMVQWQHSFWSLACHQTQACRLAAQKVLPDTTYTVLTVMLFYPVTALSSLLESLSSSQPEPTVALHLALDWP
jgi:hypothetical protein